MIYYQPTLTAPPAPCTEQIFREIIGRPAVKILCEAVRRHEELAAKVEALGDHERARRERDAKAGVKKQLPAFIFQALFPKGRRRQAECELNGLFMADFDHLEGDVRRRAEAIRSRARELGILLIHITPGGRGLRIVAVADATRGNLADNQAWLSTQLGLTADEACKDATRISFAFPAENLVHLDARLFTHTDRAFDARFGPQYRAGSSQRTRVAAAAPAAVSAAAEEPEASVGLVGSVASFPTENLSATGQETAPEAAPEASADTAPEASSAVAPEAAPDTAPEASSAVAPAYRGVPYALIIDEWWRQQGGEPVEGERNQKLHRLAAHLRYICDNSVPLLLRVMPAYGLSAEEMTGLVQSATASRLYSNRPKALTAVLAALGVDPELSAPSVSAAALSDAFLCEFDALVLPPVLRAVCSGVDENLRIGAVLAALPMLYTLLSRISFTHYDGTPSRLSGMTFVIGPAASGKSFVRELDRLLMAPIRASDAIGRQQEQEYRDSKELNKNKKEQQKKPHPCIRIVPIQISNAMLAVRLRDAVDPRDPDRRLHVYSLETELATAIRAAKAGAWIEKNDIYCKSFHNEYWGMDYANDQAVNGEVEVNLNLVVSGTEDAFDKFIPNSTVLSGLPTRLMYFPMPDAGFKMLDKQRILRSDSEEKLLLDTAYRLDALAGHYDATALTNAMYDWCGRMTRRAALEDDRELDDLRKRTALIGARAGVAYAILSDLDHLELHHSLRITPDVVRFATFVADYCLAMQYDKFALRMREQKLKMTASGGLREAPMRLSAVYNELSARFTLDDLARSRPGVVRHTLVDTCHRWTKRGFIRRIAPGLYEKIITRL